MEKQYNFTLNSIDEHVSIADCPNLNWKNNSFLGYLKAEMPSPLEFRFYINGTTDLPAVYSLAVQIDQKISRFLIKPFSRTLNTVGGGASVASGGDWYISSYSTRDAYISKGEDVKMRTVITNYEYSSIGPVYLNYQFYGPYGFESVNTYSGNGYNTGQYVRRSYGEDYPGVKSIDVDITWNINNGNGRFAFNKGTFWCEKAYAYISGYTRTRTSTEEYVSVSIPSGTHPVFVLHMVDQNFRDNHNEDSWFNYLEEHDFRMYSLFGRLTDLEDEFGINLESLVLSWSPGTTDLYGLFNYKIRQDAGSLIGKSGSWTNTQGTHSSNHGFDMLFGHVYLQNTYSGSYEVYKGAGMTWLGQNFVVLMKATVAGWIINQELGTMHEMLHTYDCDHVSAIWYIMHESWSGWVMHSTTESTIDSNINQYDEA